MERLNEIYNCIDKNGVVADVGCDHGKLEIMLIRLGKADRLIASDISPKSLEKAVIACSGAEFEGRISFRHGDGLSVLKPNEAGVIVIAGMGGLQIADILKKGAKIAHSAVLVLCPHSHEAKLRRYLLENGYGITKESLALEEGRYYQIICAKYDGSRSRELDEFYYEIGRRLLESKTPLLKGFLEYRLMQAKEIAEKAARSDKPRAGKKVEKLSAFTNRLEEYLNENQY
jgi:tRNA (adenine22-N1)-methyltransferase